MVRCWIGPPPVHIAFTTIRSIHKFLVEQLSWWDQERHFQVRGIVCSGMEEAAMFNARGWCGESVDCARLLEAQVVASADCL